MPQPLLSIVVPVYNEVGTICDVLASVRAAGLVGYELIIVDDGSTDGTGLAVKDCLAEEEFLLTSPKNEGKTSAVRRALRIASGRFVVVQDADLEYDPSTLPKLVDVAKKSSDVVYGKRPGYWMRPNRWVFAGGVLVVDVLIWLIYGRFVRDHACCYKVIPRRVIDRLQLETSGFEGCIEITAKLIRCGIPIKQVPIDYQPRGRSEGKKLTWKYGFRASAAIWRFRNWSPAS